MKKTTLKTDLDFIKLLKKLGPDAKNPSVLAGKDDGWQGRMAWNPCDKYILNPGQKISDELYEFITEHQQKQHLIVGFVSYELGNYLYGIKPSNKDGFALPLITISAYDNYLEKRDGKTYVYSQNQAFIEEISDLQQRGLQPDDEIDMKFKLVQSKETYLRAFEKVKDYICDGVVYQINLTQKLEAVSEDDSRSIFSSLAAKNDAKMQSYLEAEGFEIISMSPERFIRTDRRIIETTPIKGTRPRGKNKNQDNKNELDLLSDEKEKAELNMITDLLRNDLGKVCRPGSVKVEKARQLEKLPAVMHTFSKINGELKSDLSPFEALISMFPGGSITGCPKKKAMEIINDLESYDREAYCGNIFVINEGGNLDSSILIRTIIKKGDRALLPVGSGIVYDSVSEKEYQENLDKVESVAVSLIKK